jgi:hypothetical protein
MSYEYVVIHDPRYASSLCTFGWLPLIVYERILNNIQFVAF